ncbi:TPA: type II secretion system protein [Salmonella enterica subsp. enterica serovar Birkenhead]|uniref:pilus assembly FimT family protein n=1 Tax=Salmonella enterica TaxID=28901 RepID=UPI0012A8470F|nr:type II secretion system protein [Salmonella enterica]EBY7195067.1 type II secretion system protein [Salmonella enterica subsp. enterica serovar Birkenhead]EDV0047998.1 type II secretion system protein [Salmonella enterica subsp. enterica serovar Birkenhead]EHI3951085.1 type II secretion system protein [Salmonella enterica]EHI6135200.1 type II secretion system protein [Salmonella enterica]EHI7993465.1 type II secretion system protein [Salmonella enterica]
MSDKRSSAEDVRQSGFTLIETVVVLTIAVMMIGVGATAYSNYSENLKAKRSAEEIKSVGYAYKTFLSSVRLDVIHACEQGGNKSIGQLQISGKQNDQCYLSMANLQAGLKDYMPAGVQVPVKTPYKQPYSGRGLVKLNTADTAKSVVTPLIIAGNLKDSGVHLEELTAAKIAQLADASTGFSYARGNTVKAGGNTLFDINEINRMAQVKLPEGFMFYTGGALGVESELGYLDQQTADRRYLLRDAVPGHPEYNQMDTSLDMQDNMVITQGGVAIQPTVGLKEGALCGVKDNEGEHLIKRTESGYLVECKKSSGGRILQQGNSMAMYQVPTGGGGATDARLYAWHESGNEILNIPAYSQLYAPTTKNQPMFWRYVSPEEVADNAMFIWAKDSQYFKKETNRRLGIHIPEWYPYGKVKICPVLFKKNNEQLVDSSFLKAGQITTQKEVYAIYNTPIGSTPMYQSLNDISCFEMSPGESRAVFGYVHSIVIRYKGNIVPAFIRKFYTTGTLCPSIDGIVGDAD